MTPLVRSITKNLQPCSGCGKSVNWQLVPLPSNQNMKQFSVNISLDPQNPDALQKLGNIGTNTQVRASTVIEAETMPEALKKLDGIGEVSSIQQRPTQAQQVMAQSGVRLPTVLTNMKTGQPVQS